jgi:tRNA threonylcarbamoyl adenosine modification protein (Sua5/YciO/YrdC/YwlC family)
VFVRIHPLNPEERKLKQIIDCLNNGGLIIYPTDTVYSVGCSIMHTQAVQRLYRFKGVTEKTAQFSFICESFTQLSTYAKSIDTTLYRVLKKVLPGPYTFIMAASKQVPKVLHSKKNTVGLRLPHNNICNSIVQLLGHPIISTSLPLSDEIEHYIDPEIFYDDFAHQVDIVIDGGLGSPMPSTVFNVADWPIVELIRVGAGDENIFD